jgi:hypothetical protein
VIVEGPEAVWPTLGGGEIVRGVPPKRDVVVEPPPISQPTEWAEAPKPSVDEWEAMPTPAPTSVARLAEEPVVVEKPKVVAKDLESIFLERAEESIMKGSCDRFLLGLEDIATDNEHPRSEQARVLRARCFDSQMRPRQAMNEYRKYLELHPRGKFAAEAHQALGE